ncbi:MAG: cobalamin biosynthesis protein CbiD [Candidatus Brocadia sp. UTAMX2]|jgi:cobalt-precorrin-5B (C1)-methyltransferase|nr:MAG: cobalamin biosynthesis protein CbiD [Candidatus Brocadia sp. UTAMX2]
MRFGYTTGSCATAAAKAAAIGLFQGIIPDEVEIDTPAGITLRLTITDKQLSNGSADCAVQKDAGDDPDVTHGCKVHARIERIIGETIEIDGGEGVGRVTKPGLQVPVGHAAINPVPRSMIEHAVREVIGKDTGAKVIISVPNGSALAEKTFNPKLGIVGGISIIGTTGIVRPMSEDAFKTSLLCGLDIAGGIGYETVVLVPGSLGERSILNLVDIPKDQIIQISNFVGFMLDEARKRHFKKIILAGHPGKLAKLLRGDFHTHSAVSKPANDIMFDIIKQHMQNRDQGSEVRCQESAAKNSPFDTSSPDSIKKRDESKSALSRNTKVKSPPLSGTMLKGFKEATTVEGMVELLQEYGNLSIMDKIAGMIEAKIYAFYQDGQQYIRPEVGVILFDMKGSVVGISDSAQSWLNHTKTKLLS